MSNPEQVRDADFDPAADYDRQVMELLLLQEEQGVILRQHEFVQKVHDSMTPRDAEMIEGTSLLRIMATSGDTYAPAIGKLLTSNIGLRVEAFKAPQYTDRPYAYLTPIGTVNHETGSVSPWQNFKETDVRIVAGLVAVLRDKLYHGSLSRLDLFMGDIIPPPEMNR
jgi:hypothetical protein